MKDHACSETLSLEIGNAELEFKVFETADAKLTGRQIVEMFGGSPVSEHLVFKLDAKGRPQEVSLKETVLIEDSVQSRFVVFNSTASYRFSLDECVYEWGDSDVSGAVLEELFVPEGSSKRVWMAHRDKPDKAVGDSVIDLTDDGLERFYLKEQVWLLNVQGVEIRSDSPKIQVSEAIEKAGFDASSGWLAVLKVCGEPKKPVTLCDEIDLTASGIEKLRLMPKEIRNGEVATPRQDFNILAGDEQFLQERGFAWETVVDNDRRWFLLRGYPLPEGYQQTKADIAIEIPTGYPAAQLDMFYCYPHLQRADGRPIPTTEARQQIQSKSYQRWSRHRGATTPWNPQFDSLVTQLVLAEESILREVSP